MDLGVVGMFASALFTITNPIGNTAIFASLTGGKSASEQSVIARQAAFAITLTLLIVLWAGHYLLDFFGVSVPSLEVAGGLIVLSLGLSMLHSETSKQSQTDAEEHAANAKESVAVVPLAIPIVAGPGAITTVLITAGNHAGELVTLLGYSAVCVGFGLIFWLCFRSAARISSTLGVHGVAIVTRIMGMVLAAIAISMMASGLKTLLPGLA